MVRTGLERARVSRDVFETLLDGVLSASSSIGISIGKSAIKTILGPAFDEAKQYAKAYLTQPENHDLERSLRFSALLACLTLVREQAKIEEAEAAGQRSAPPDTFCPAARKWLHGQFFALSQMQDGTHQARSAAYKTSLNTALASQPDPRDTAQAARDREHAEQIMWQEFRAALPDRHFPPDFEDRFLGSAGHGWFGYFITFLCEALKTQDSARNAFFIGGLSNLRNAVTRIEAKIDILPTAKDNAAAVVDEFERRGLSARAKEQGLTEIAIIALAKQLNPKLTQDLEQALLELQAAVDIALDIRRRGMTPGSNEDSFITEILAEVAKRNQEGQLDAGASAVDSGLLELDTLALEQQEALRRKRITLLEAGIEQDLLRRDAVGVAKRIETLVALDTPHRPSWTPAFIERGNAFYAEGEDKGVNLLLEVALAMAKRMRTTAVTTRERGSALHLIGDTLWRLGDREAGTNRLEEAIKAYHAALKVFVKRGIDLNWAATQNNLGGALHAIGKRQVGTKHIKEAIVAYRRALLVHTRERTPLLWAGTQNNLGNALSELGEREGTIARFQEAVNAFRAALQEYTRDRAPLEWAAAQNNLGTALGRLGEREAGTTQLREAIAAYRAALEEWTRDRVPLRWAGTQNNLGNALQRLGFREASAGPLIEAIMAHREALKELTRERAPLDWATTQSNLGTALTTLGQRLADSTRLEEAVTAFGEALQESTRERAPLDWAATQHNLGAALQALGQNESGTARLEKAIATFRAALQERTRDRIAGDWASTQFNLATCFNALAERSDTPGPHLADAITHMQNAVDGYQQVGDEYWGPIAERLLAELKAKAR
jgi:tetratricopeptide (TPR) repeat protein